MYLHPVEMIFWMDILYMVPPILKCPVRDNLTGPVRNAIFLNNDAQATFFLNLVYI